MLIRPTPRRRSPAASSGRSCQNRLNENKITRGMMRLGNANPGFARLLALGLPWVGRNSICFGPGVMVAGFGQLDQRCHHGNHQSGRTNKESETTHRSYPGTASNHSDMLGLVLRQATRQVRSNKRVSFAAGRSRCRMEGATKPGEPLSMGSCPPSLSARRVSCL